MKKTILLLSATFLLILSSCNSSSTNEKATDKTVQSATLDTTKLKTGETFYQCEMDPKVISDKAGVCPTCGMDLVEIKKK